LLIGLVACVVPASATANTSHHHLGGGGGLDPDADCLLWGYLTSTDGAAPDAPVGSDAGSDADAGGADAAPPPDGGMVCLEHATLFGCDCASGGGARSSEAAVASMLLLGLGMLRRRGSRRRRGKTDP
jgi:hypothetical protein